MAAVSELRGLLFFLRHLLSPAVFCSRILKKLLGRLSVLWSIFCRKLSGGGYPDTSATTKGRQTGDGESDCRGGTSKVNTETVSLDGAAFSLYPFSGGIRNSSRSSQNLRASMSAHNLAIATRNASRASYRTGESNYSTSAYTASNFEEEGPYTITVQPNSPTSPTPVRQYSISLPQLSGAASPTAHGTAWPHQSFSNVVHATTSGASEEVLSPQEIEVTSLHIPTRPSTPQSALPQKYLEQPKITPVMPESTQRYIRRPRIRKGQTEMTIEPLTINFDKPLPPTGWTRYIHLEGARYFYHKEKRICTDADLHDSKILSQTEENITIIEDFIYENNICMPEDSDLVLDVFYDEETKEVSTTYYYVHHPTRSIFFLDPYEAESLTAWHEVEGIRTQNHLRHEIHAQYWYCIQLYPHMLRNLTREIIAELRGAALHCIGDSMTSPTSTAPYTLDDLYKILSLTNTMDKNIGTQDDGVKSILARIMYVFVHSRFLDWHGEAHARIERNFSVYGQAVNSRTWLVKSMSMVLFFAPEFHLRTLQNMWVDNIMHKSVWHESMKKMNDEWQEFVLFATVMLNANVAFLAIQSVDTDTDPYRSPAQISSYMSVVASIGSIVLGLLLIRQNRTKNRESADDVQAFLTKITHPRLGLETLAILYSLPYALLMWGLVCFLAAFSFVCFQDSSSATRALVGSLCFVVVVLVIWCVKTSWAEQPMPDVPIIPESDPASVSDNGSSDKLSEKSVNKPTFLSRISAFLSYRKATYDSQKTAVDAPV
ncbi:hypothetical protein CPC08DRAFT_746116 [Agrocybe pediades]|nr:hypothetical protein CPC08DRAFT_746116 [Agrocybe pediades]